MDSKRSVLLFLRLLPSEMRGEGVGTLCLTFTDPEHFGYFKKQPIFTSDHIREKLQLFIQQEALALYFFFFFFCSQIRTQLCSQQTVGGQGSQHSQCLREERDFLKLRGGPQSKFFLMFICLCLHLFGVKSLMLRRPTHSAVLVQLIS